MGTKKETPYERDLQKLRDSNPSDGDALLDVLRLSPNSPEGYYASMVFEWMMERGHIY